MGRAKQLLPYRGTTLLGHAVRAAVSSRCSPILVVVGSEAAQMLAQLSDQPVSVITNLAWASGMGSSIRAGLTQLLAQTSPPAVVIMLCDQPAVTAEILDGLVDRYQRDCPPIVASSYDGICGVPALFDATLFGELLEIDDCCGAREVIQRHESVVAPIAFPQGWIDVDNPDDYQRLK